MTIETAPRRTITIESTEVSSLREGDLIHIALPLPQYRVLRNTGRGHLLARTRRSAVTLVDSEGVKKRFLLSPKRTIERVTNPAIPVGPWFFDLTGTAISDYLRLWQREDALWYKTLWPLANPFVQLWRGILDLQCRVYSVKLQTGFLSVMVIIVAVVIGLVTGTPDELSVPIGIVGAFSLQQYWEYWNLKTRRKLVKGTFLRVRYKPHGPEKLRYGTLELRKKGALVLGGRPGQVWFTTEMVLHQGELVLAECAFANDIRGDLTYTTSAVAEAIRHRLDNGSRRVISAPSSKHDPERDPLPDISISPSFIGVSPSVSRTTENRPEDSASNSSCTRRGYWPTCWKSWTKAVDSEIVGYRVD